MRDLTVLKSWSLPSLLLYISWNGWMAYDFMSFSTLFQANQDNERVIMKGCVQGNPILRLKRSPPHAGIEPEIARSAASA